MKFYKDKNNYYWFKIRRNKLTVIYHDNRCVFFYKNGKRHNSKNASFVDSNTLKVFRLNDKFYGDEKKFTKKSWRRFVKMQIFK